jgi:hypothetical protein
MTVSGDATPVPMCASFATRPSRSGNGESPEPRTRRSWRLPGSQAPVRRSPGERGSTGTRRWSSSDTFEPVSVIERDAADGRLSGPCCHEARGGKSRAHGSESPAHAPRRHHGTRRRPARRVRREATHPSSATHLTRDVGTSVVRDDDDVARAGVGNCASETADESSSANDESIYPDQAPGRLTSPRSRNWLRALRRDRPHLRRQSSHRRSRTRRS